jgi:hypothetical protein
MKKVIMTFSTVDAAGKPDGGAIDVEFGVEQKATPANSVTRFKFTLSPALTGGSPIECRLAWADSAQLEQLVGNILSTNPVP